ncbi:MAG: FAD-binding oxidoreductase [Actinomycetota bacterium]|nr:FAD-binding oxidoreductase [Actinomycetota bacterium]
MKFPASVMSALRDAEPVPPPAGLEAAGAVAPHSPEQAALLMSACAAEGLTVGFWGSGARREVGGARPYDMGLLSSQMADVIDWQVDDLTIVVGSGMTVGTLERLLASERQTSLLPTMDPSRTIGGLIAEGASGYARLKYGPSRDRVLETTIVTGYGKIVRGGGRLVKNVTGYDLPRLVTGSLGSLGFITSVCLKLWPVAITSATGRVRDAQEALERLYRPVAVLETDVGNFATFEGSVSDVRSQVLAAEATVEGEPRWPAPITSPVMLSIRVPPRLVRDARSGVVEAGANRWIAQHGVGVVDAGFETLPIDRFAALRSEVEAMGGAAVVIRSGRQLEGVDPWGAVPSTFGVQTSMKALFDPAGVCNPGKLPGGL